MEVKNVSIRFSARCRDCAGSHCNGAFWNISAHRLALDQVGSASTTSPSNGHHRLASRRLKRKIKLIKLLERKRISILNIMSFRYTNWVFANASHYQWGCGLQLVLLSLADQMNQHGECWPSHKHTANRVGLSEKQVRRHVTKLKSLGLITVVRNEKGGKPGDTPRYRALFKVSDDAKGHRAPADGRPTAPPNVLLETHISPRGLPSMSEHPSHEWEPNHHRIINEPSVNQRERLTKKMPIKLNSWKDIVEAGKFLGLAIGDYELIESQSAFEKRVRAAHADYWKTGEISPPRKPK